MTDVPTLSDLPRPDLAVLAREYLLCGHLIDRAGMGYLIGPYGLEGMRDVAIDEWMGASPVYTDRMQRLLGFAGDDVATIFKGMQFDIGAPHEFLDFRFTVHDATHGEFHLDHCGALMDVEPMGEDFVVAMCHAIEDPTFDATACASNPKAQVRPVHRPPRTPADRHPHCAWTVEIPDDATPVAEVEVTALIRATRAAGLPLADITAWDGPDGEGRSDYAGEFVDRLQLEEFSKGALLGIIDEVCLQHHLLSTAFMLAVERRHGTEAAVQVGDHQFTGIAGLAAERFHRVLGLGRDASAIAQVLELHPALRPRAYVDTRVALDGDEVTVSLHPSPATEERAVETWVRLLVDGHGRPLDAIVHAVDPHARCEPVPAADGALASWRVVVGPDEVGEQPEVGVARFSTGADFTFEAPSEVSVELGRPGT
jgi:hypothetical protein